MTRRHWTEDEYLFVGCCENRRGFVAFRTTLFEEFRQRVCEINRSSHPALSRSHTLFVEGLEHCEVIAVELTEDGGHVWLSLFLTFEKDFYPKINAELEQQLSHPPDSFDKPFPVLHNMDDSAPKSATMESNLTEIHVTNAKRKRSRGKYEVSDNIMKYDESLVGTKLEVWWPLDQMYYEAVVAEFYPDRNMHKVLYADGDEETLNLREEKWRSKYYVRDDEEHNTEVQLEEGSPDIHKKKKSKTDPAASQEKIKDSAKKFVSLSKEVAKSKEDEETLKTSSKTKKVNKSKDKTPPSSSSKFNTSGPTKAEKMEYDKAKDGRKLRLEDRRLRLEAKKLRFKADKAQSKIRQEDERLRLEAEKRKLLKKESDILIMRMDRSVMPEMQRRYFEELQKEITMRGDHA